MRQTKPGKWKKNNRKKLFYQNKNTPFVKKALQKESNKYKSYFSIVFKRINELWGKYSRVWSTKQIVGKLLENFRKCSKIFLGKLLIIHYLAYFSNKFNKPCVYFSRVWTKTTICWKFLRNFQKFS